jgi:hypothetical protein
MARTPLTRPWTSEETEKLKELLASGATPLTASLKLRRKFNSVKKKIWEIRNPGHRDGPQGPGNGRSL